MTSSRLTVQSDLQQLSFPHSKTLHNFTKWVPVGYGPQLLDLQGFLCCLRPPVGFHHHLWPPEGFHLNCRPPDQRPSPRPPGLSLNWLCSLEFWEKSGLTPHRGACCAQYSSHRCRQSYQRIITWCNIFDMLPFWSMSNVISPNQFNHRVYWTPTNVITARSLERPFC